MQIAHRGSKRPRESEGLGEVSIGLIRILLKFVLESIVIEGSELDVNSCYAIAPNAPNVWR